MKTHLRSTAPVDYREHGQTEHEFNNQAECGYARKNVTRVKSDVTCFYCKAKMLRSDDSCQK